MPTPSCEGSVTVATIKSESLAKSSESRAPADRSVLGARRIARSRLSSMVSTLMMLSAEFIRDCSLEVNFLISELLHATSPKAANPIRKTLLALVYIICFIINLFLQKSHCIHLATLSTSHKSELLSGCSLD